jgi:hypothetical protein
MYRWNKQYCNLFYRDTLQIAFDWRGIISRNEQLLMQEEGGGGLFFVLWYSNAAELLRDEEKKNYVMTRITGTGRQKEVD